MSVYNEMGLVWGGPRETLSGWHEGGWDRADHPPSFGDEVMRGCTPRSTTLGLGATTRIPDRPGERFQSRFVLPLSPYYRLLHRDWGHGDTSRGPAGPLVTSDHRYHYETLDPADTRPRIVVEELLAE